VLEREYEAGPSRLLVDLSQVEFVDSSTLNVFAVTEARLRDGGIAFELINPTAAIRRLLVITNLDQVLLTEEPERKGTT
jgi:anti-sigma B factor antagonist